MTVKNGIYQRDFDRHKSNYCKEKNNANFCKRYFTYKCLVWCIISRPGVVPLDMGMGPSSWFSAKSSQYKFERLPMAAGIGPENLLEFKDLQLK